MICGARDVIGDKGGGKGGSDGSTRTPVEAPNTLRSRSTVRVVDLISEGPIVGLVDGDKSIFLNETPLQNSDGTYNFEGVTYTTRDGSPDQEPIQGFARSESEVNVNVQIKKSISVSRTITNVNADAVRVKIRVPRLTNLNSSTGDLNGTEVEVAIDLKTDTGSFVEQTVMTISGKTTSPYERSVRIELPSGGNPWTIRCRRLTDDSDEATLDNDTFLSSYTEVIDAKLSYPDCALIGYEIDAETFGSYIPDRASHIRGIISAVPSNYNPVARTYSGLWDGTFKQAWHNNPAWVMWDLLRNERYGLGDVIAEESIDKFGLYSISQYCDELVPDGFGGTEPRFSFNGVISSRTDAAKALDAVASTFRAMLYWGAGSVTMVQDAPASAVKLVTPANVIDGEFAYTGSAMKARHSVVVVGWNDPDDLSRITYEVVRRDDLIKKYGIREKRINAYGCTSRGQARRHGEWMLETENSETEIVTYRAALDHADVRPGQIIAVADPSYAGARFGGRIVSATTTEVVIDDGIDIETGETYQLSVVLADGSVETKPITTGVGSGITTLTVDPPFSVAPEANAMWVVAASNAAPRKFRVISNREKDKNIYEITALFHNANKYDLVDRDQNLEDEDYSLWPTGQLGAPTGIDFQEFTRVVNGAVSTGVQISWNTASDPRTQSVEVQVKSTNDITWRPLGMTSIAGIEDLPTYYGDYSVRLRSTAAFYKSSQWVDVSTVLLASNQPIGDVQNFKINNNGLTTILSWDKLDDLLVDHYEVRYSSLTSGADWASSSVIVSNISAATLETTVQSRVGSYLIKAVSFAGIYSVNAAIVTSAIAAAENINIIETISEHPDWPGTHNNTAVVRGGELILRGEEPPMATWNPLASMKPLSGDYLPLGTYQFANRISLGAVMRVYASVDLDAYGFNVDDVMANWVTLASVDTLTAPTSGLWAVTLQFRTTNDDPTGSPVWSDWVNFVVGFYQCRAMEFKLVLESSAVNVTPRVKTMSVTADMEDRIDSGDDVVCPAGGVSVLFSAGFMAVPAVVIDGQQMVTGDYSRVTNKTVSGFDIEFFNSSGASIERSFDWVAKGYGYRQ